MTSHFIIDDSNFQTHMDRSDPRCGCIPGESGIGKVKGVWAPVRQIIPMEEWPDRIADLERRKGFAKHIWEDSPIGVLNQGQVGYCHAFSAVAGLMIKRHSMSLPYVELSPSSVGAPITGYQNQGAVITDDLQQMVEVGVASTRFVPTLTTSREDFKTGWEVDASANKVTLFYELKERSFLQQGTELLCGEPVMVALNYWGHAVTDVRLLDLYRNLESTNPFRYGVEFLNSWDKTWGNGGFGVRTQSKMIADMAYITHQIRASAPSNARKTSVAA